MWSVIAPISTILKPFEDHPSLSRDGPTLFQPIGGRTQVLEMGSIGETPYQGMLPSPLSLDYRFNTPYPLGVEHILAYKNLILKNT